jgi:hypothetical protein
MSKVTLDHLRKGGVARGLPERAYSLCLRRDLLAEVDSVTEQLRDVMVADASADPENLPPPRLGAPGVSEQEQEVRARLAALYDEMDDSTGELRLRAIRDGDWRQWVNAHPAARGEQARRAGRLRDLQRRRPGQRPRPVGRVVGRRDAGGRRLVGAPRPAAAQAAT